jgi:thiamine pyrophosphokinase
VEVTMRAVIFANGTFDDADLARAELGAGDLILAVDGGTRHAWEAGVDPQLVIGDLDSLTTEEQQRLRSSSAEISSFSARKDQTDLELALVRAVSEGAESILIFGALGGRIDQTVANVLIAVQPEFGDVDIRIVKGAQTAFLIRDHAVLDGEPGDVVSLIPLGGDATGVTTEGLEWSLDDETLHFGSTRGISNVQKREQAQVRVRQGQLLCVVTHADE